MITVTMQTAKRLIIVIVIMATGLFVVEIGFDSLRKSMYVL
jgi:hypothetical protein